METVSVLSRDKSFQFLWLDLENTRLDVSKPFGPHRFWVGHTFVARDLNRTNANSSSFRRKFLVAQESNHEWVPSCGLVTWTSVSTPMKPHFLADSRKIHRRRFLTLP
jgi:hypothetical protein